ncbi:uncharacterized protein A4U43_C10F19080 [Asparagus officinalis]|uniref:Cyclin-dependent kinase inhibitor domain-containing protein n=1 Tax=Asparagus officinalis TaxID=4686 RepID=A0A5P1E3Y0_ASPOF|nr:cyclin-dependent kinase inhibitor 5-like [Asparagus officinalis]ONK57341.1 uncharacterized protein A4U43_C10F19080 [Asparagus officinalis]
MGRYMRKTKSGEIAVMELSSPQSAVGVRTRAKTLALQRLQSDSSSYLELRSRRLEKPKELCRESPNKSKSAVSSPSSNGEEVEASFGENFLDFDPARNIRETTPCSLIRDPDSIPTPGSTTKKSNKSSNRRRTHNSIHQNIPNTHEMEEFFACAERFQQTIFTEKYNYDPVNDCPLPGRYEWVKVE